MIWYTVIWSAVYKNIKTADTDFSSRNGKFPLCEEKLVFELSVYRFQHKPKKEIPQVKKNPREERFA